MRHILYEHKYCGFFLAKRIFRYPDEGTFEYREYRDEENPHTLLESFVTSNSNVILSGLPRLLQNLLKFLGIDLQGPNGPVEVLVDEDRLAGHDVVIRGIAVGAELIKKASGSKKINKTMLHCAFFLNCAT
jgi:hypothetical protein